MSWHTIVILAAMVAGYLAAPYVKAQSIHIEDSGPVRTVRTTPSTINVKDADGARYQFAITVDDHGVARVVCASDK
jgi:hypothetical protein